MKIRIGISAGGEDIGPEAMVALAQGITGTGFDSLWLPEILTRPGPDPLVGLAWVAGACPGLKIGTTMLLPGRNLVWLAKAVATLDVLSGGHFLLTFVPGLAVGGDRFRRVDCRVIESQPRQLTTVFSEREYTHSAGQNRSL